MTHMKAENHWTFTSTRDSISIYDRGLAKDGPLPLVSATGVFRVFLSSWVDADGVPESVERIGTLPCPTQGSSRPLEDGGLIPHVKKERGKSDRLLRLRVLSFNASLKLGSNSRCSPGL